MWIATLLMALVGPTVASQAPAPAATAALGQMQAEKQPISCEQCAAWNTQTKPFKIHGQTYYVGVQGGP